MKVRTHLCHKWTHASQSHTSRCHGACKRPEWPRRPPPRAAAPAAIPRPHQPHAPPRRRAARPRPRRHRRPHGDARARPPEPPRRVRAGDRAGRPPAGAGRVRRHPVVRVRAEQELRAPFRDLSPARSGRKEEEDGGGVACVVADVDWFAPLAAARELGVPALALMTSSAARFRVYLAYPRLCEKGYLPVQGN